MRNRKKNYTIKKNDYTFVFLFTMSRILSFDRPSGHQTRCTPLVLFVFWKFVWNRWEAIVQDSRASIALTHTLDTSTSTLCQNTSNDRCACFLARCVQSTCYRMVSQRSLSIKCLPHDAHDVCTQHSKDYVVKTQSHQVRMN